MKRPWSFAVNPFYNATKKSLRKAYKMSVAHDNYLFQKKTSDPTDPDWTTLYGRYHPLHIAFSVAYTNWKSGGGSLMGVTKSLKDLFKLVPQMLDQWIAIIIPIYNKASAKYLAFFPNGRTPFERGSAEDRIAAIKTLSTTIGADISIAPAKTQIDAAYADLSGARNMQEGGKFNKKSLSEIVETAKKGAMNGQYRDLGFLTDKYYETPSKIEPFFDLDTLRSTVQSIFTKTMGQTETYSLTKNAFKSGEELRLKVADAGNLTDSATIYLASTLGGIDSTGITVLNKGELKFDPIEFDVDLLTHTFLTVVTNGNINSLKLAVELY